MKKVLISVIIMIILVFIGFEILTESNSILNSVSFSFKIWENNIFLDPVVRELLWTLTKISRNIQCEI